MSKYDKMEDYIISLFNVFKNTNNLANKNNDKRLKIICLVLYNYTRYMAKEYNINLRENLELNNSINLIPIFEYISINNIELYDFNKITFNDVDVTKKEDLERYVLTYVYYLTQNSV